MKNIRIISLTICLFLFSVTVSQAVVELVDTESSGIRQDIDNNITSGLIATGSGLPGDFVVLMCSTFSGGNNSFLDPTPGDWATLDSGACGGTRQCIVGIFGRFDESSGSSDISCNWTDPTNAFAAGSFRNRGVDNDNPVIDVACNSGGVGSEIIAPSVITEPGSAVIRVLTIGGRAAGDLQSNHIVQGDFQAAGVSQQTGEVVLAFGESEKFLIGGPTGTIDEGFLPADWRACTIALRMAPENIPTLSEWGLGIFVALIGIVAVFALRRRTERA